MIVVRVSVVLVREPVVDLLLSLVVAPAAAVADAGERGLGAYH
jgi:hypothetical protein